MKIRSAILKLLRADRREDGMENYCNSLLWKRKKERGLFVCCFKGETGAGVAQSALSGYGLDYRAIEVRFPVRAKDFSSSVCAQTSSRAHPASCPMCTGGSFLGGKARPGRDADHSPPSSAEVMNE
jgi:hypothetical protein